MNAPTAIHTAARDDNVKRFFNIIAGERDALSRFLRQHPRPDIAEVIALIARQNQPIIVTGIGKSGHIASKVAATFSSLDIAAFSLNAAEAAHGDLGVVQPGSVVIMLSNSGSTEEIVRLVPFMRARHCTMVAIVGNKASPLARASDHLILAEVDEEACPLGMAPTSSSTLHLAIGDALAIAVSRSRGLTREDFLRQHPAGLLGRQMILVKSLMRQGGDLPTVQAGTPLLEMLAIMSAKRMGAACVVGEDDHLLGLVVDGDVRRYLQQGDGLAEATAASVMQARPRTIHESATLGDALRLRKSAGTGWLVMLVVDHSGHLKGMLHAQDVFG
ncbi:MAG: KpsF/GutQ family sugar-phosphate isomerase [Pseudomonadota bacterium]